MPIVPTDQAKARAFDAKRREELEKRKRDREERQRRIMAEEEDLHNLAQAAREKMGIAPDVPLTMIVCDRRRRF